LNHSEYFKHGDYSEDKVLRRLRIFTLVKAQTT
jgi:hypothetical protein